MSHDALEHVHTATKVLAAKVALTDDLVAVLMSAARILGIVEVHGTQAVKADHAVELVQNAVQIMDDVVARVAYMARIHANAQAAIKFRTARHNALDNSRDLLKAATNFCTLARHGLKQDAGGLTLKHHLAQGLDNELDAALGALAHLRTGMEIVVLTGQHLHALQVLRHGA